MDATRPGGHRMILSIDRLSEQCCNLNVPLSLETISQATGCEILAEPMLEGHGVTLHQ